MVTAVFIRIDDRRVTGDRFAENPVTGGLVAMSNHPTPLFPGLAADNMNDRRPVVVIGAVARLLVGASSRQVVGGAMGRTFFPPRSGKSHPPRTSGHPSDL